MLASFADKVAHRVAQNDAAFTQGYAAVEIDNVDAIHLPAACFQSHFTSSLEFAASWPTCLTRVTSVPGSRFLIVTSSIKERMRKMPRPDGFIKLSGASGSGMDCGSSPLPWSVTVMTIPLGVIS